VAQLLLHLAVEDLPGELLRLLQDHAAVLGVRVVAEIRALVDEALAVGVDVHAPRIGMLLEAVAHREVAGLGRVAIPRHRVASRPVAVRRRADLERHADRVAGVEARAAHLGELPARAHVARSPFGIRLESSRSQYYGCGGQGFRLALVLDHHSMNPGVIRDQRDGSCAVHDLDARLLRELRQRFDQPRPAADRFHREAAPELELAADLERLPAPRRSEAHAALSHPLRGRQALLDEDFGEVRIAAVLGDPRHVVEELLFGIGAEVGVGDFLRREVRDQRLEIVRPAVGEAEQSRGEARVAARFVLGGALQDEDLLLVLGRGKRRAQRCVPSAHYDDVVLHQSILMWAFWMTSFQRACSLATKSAYSCGVEPIGSASSGLKRSMTAAVFTALAASSARRLTMAGGVFPGADSPYHCEVSKPG